MHIGACLSMSDPVNQESLIVSRNAWGGPLSADSLQFLAKARERTHARNSAVHSAARDGRTSHAPSWQARLAKQPVCALTQGRRKYSWADLGGSQCGLPSWRCVVSSSRRGDEPLYREQCLEPRGKIFRLGKVVRLLKLIWYETRCICFGATFTKCSRIAAQ